MHGFKKFFPLSFLAFLAGCGAGSFQEKRPSLAPSPTISFDLPVTGEQIIGNQLSVSVHAHGASPVSSIRLLLDGNFLAMADGAVLQGTFQVAPGKHWLEAIAVDAQNNHGYGWLQFSAVNRLQLVTNLPADGSVLSSPLSISAS